MLPIFAYADDFFNHRLRKTMKLATGNTQALNNQNLIDQNKSKGNLKGGPEGSSVTDQTQFEALMDQPIDAIESNTSNSDGWTSGFDMAMTPDDQIDAANSSSLDNQSATSEKNDLANRARSATQIAGYLAGFNGELSGHNGLGTWESKSVATPIGPVEIVPAESTAREYGGEPAGEHVGAGVRADLGPLEGGVYYNGHYTTLELGSGLSLNEIISAAATAVGMPGVGLVLSSLDETGILSAEVGAKVTVDIGSTHADDAHGGETAVGDAHADDVHEGDVEEGLLFMRINTGTKLNVGALEKVDGELSAGRSYQIIFDGKGELGVSSNLPDRL